MSLEQALAANTAALLALTAQLQGASAPAVPQATAAPILPPAPPVAPPAAPAMPAPPFAVPAAPAAPAAPVAPAMFTDTAGLVAFATEQFHRLEALGADKGHQITAILTAWGIDDMAKIPPEGFKPFYDAVLALR